MHQLEGAPNVIMTEGSLEVIESYLRESGERLEVEQETETAFGARIGSIAAYSLSPHRMLSGSLTHLATKIIKKTTP